MYPYNKYYSRGNAERSADRGGGRERNGLAEALLVIRVGTIIIKQAKPELLRFEKVDAYKKK
jgi:hypothetical protein